MGSHQHIAISTKTDHHCTLVATANQLITNIAKVCARVIIELNQRAACESIPS